MFREGKSGGLVEERRLKLNLTCRCDQLYDCRQRRLYSRLYSNEVVGWPRRYSCIPVERQIAWLRVSARMSVGRLSRPDTLREKLPKDSLHRSKNVFCNNIGRGDKLPLANITSHCRHTCRGPALHVNIGADVASQPHRSTPKIS